MSISIYHNPRCSKSRRALELLREHGVEPAIIEYLKTPPSPETLDELLKLLDMDPRDLIRAKETAYKEAGLDDPNLTRSALIRGMTENPILIERPIVVADGKAALGRPPEKVLEII